MYLPRFSPRFQCGEPLEHLRAAALLSNRHSVESVTALILVQMRRLRYENDKRRYCLEKAGLKSALIWQTMSVPVKVQDEQAGVVVIQNAVIPFWHFVIIKDIPVLFHYPIHDKCMMRVLKKRCLVVPNKKANLMLTNRYREKVILKMLSIKRARMIPIEDNFTDFFRTMNSEQLWHPAQFDIDCYSQYMNVSSRNILLKL